MKSKRLTDSERYAAIIDRVKKATDRDITIEDVQRVQRGDFIPSHPVEAAIHAALRQIK